MLPTKFERGIVMKQGINYQNVVNNIDIEFDKFGQNLTYGELCLEFNLPKLRGGYIKRQIELIQRDYDLIKDGKYYNVLKKFTTEEKLATQRYNNLKSYIEILMCTLFAIPKEEFVIELTMKELLQKLKIVNRDFHDTKIKENIKIAIELLNITSEPIEIYDDGIKNSLEIFLSETEPMLNRIVKEVMSGLENKKIIEKKTIPILAKKVYKNGKLSYTKKKVVNTPKLDKDFLEAQYDALEILKNDGCIYKAEETEVQKQGKRTISLYREITARKLGYEYWYPLYVLTLNKKYLNRFEMFVIRDVEEKYKINTICNKIVKDKLLASNQGNLKLINKEDRITYINTFIDSNVDVGLRDIYKERKKEKTK